MAETKNGAAKKATPAPQITKQAAEKPKAGDQLENSPFPVSVDRNGNRKMIPTEMVDFKYGAGSRFHEEGYVQSMHTILAESFSARKKGVIIGETKKVKTPKKYAGAQDAPTDN